MNQSKVISVVMVVCFLSGILVGVSMVGRELDLTKALLVTTEEQVKLLQEQVEVLKATVRVLRNLVEFYEDLLGISRQPPSRGPRI